MPSHIGFILLLSLSIIAYFPADAQKKKVKKSVPEFGINVGITTTYDDNILKYSDKYLERFMNREDEGRFHIDTYDDIILQPTLQLTSGYKIFKNLKSEVNVDFNTRFYMVNDIKNYSSVSLGFRQYVSKRTNFKLIYNHIPQFYIRHFRDADRVEIYGYTAETFVPMGFSKNMYGMFIHQTFLKNTGLRLTANYSNYYYNKHYTEYDCNDMFWGLRLYQPITKKLRVELGYGFTTSDAKGFDEPDESKENSDDSNADFQEDGFLFGFSYQLPNLYKLKHNIEGDYEFEKRYFTTDNFIELDPEHAGRIDQNQKISVAYNLSINKSITVSAFYNWLKRNSKTSSPINSEYVTIEKDYHQNQVGISVDFKLK